MHLECIFRFRSSTGTWFFYEIGMNLRNEQKIRLCDWRYARRQGIQLSIANTNITYIF